VFIRVHPWQISLLLAIPLTYALVASTRLARADLLARHDTVDALLAASRIEPANAEYHARIASLDPSRQDQLLAALQLNPRNPSWWIMQSIRQEEDGDLAGAEASLLRANAVCRYYTPRWSLASFYYRQKNLSGFAQWARASMSVGYGDSESLFRMAQKLGLSSEAILRDMVPGNPDKVAAYLYMMMSDGNVDRLYQPAAKLVDLGATTSRNAVLDNSETLFLHGRTAQALDLWNRTVDARWVAFSALDPKAGKSLARGNFRGERIEKGFDWKYPVPQGVSVSAAESDGSLRLEFSGKEPPACELASQLIPLLPRRKYHLTVRYRGESIPPDSGLQWSVVTATPGPPVATLPLHAPAAQVAEQSADFQTPPTQVPMKLLLSYSRAPGTTRVEGTLWIESVNLTLAPTSEHD
jgi:hypothetical protein